MSKQLKITLFRGFAGKTKKQRAIARALGLRKREQVVIHQDSPTIRGMVNKIPHMLIVEEIEE
ncbi:MAG: 50S ribosomal protein L30 [Firmicutes bacterium]|jgi:large subunit ribosomal protein L30|nr:50S ribosomal protein L30 [Bacillota bacterium]